MHTISVKSACFLHKVAVWPSSLYSGGPKSSSEAMSCVKCTIPLNWLTPAYSSLSIIREKLAWLIKRPVDWQYRYKYFIRGFCFILSSEKPNMIIQITLNMPLPEMVKSYAEGIQSDLMMMNAYQWWHMKMNEDKWRGMLINAN